VKGAWLVIESIPEKLPLKIEVFGQLDQIADPDAILATNSSSYRSGEMKEKVKGRHRSEYIFESHTKMHMNPPK
jgi:3-hydroxyacyl-CoA dehydrogenase